MNIYGVLALVTVGRFIVCMAVLVSNQNYGLNFNFSHFSKPVFNFQQLFVLIFKFFTNIVGFFFLKKKSL